jgi:hypothetical protein
MAVWLLGVFLNGWRIVFFYFFNRRVVFFPDIDLRVTSDLNGLLVTIIVQLFSAIELPLTA